MNAPWPLLVLLVMLFLGLAAWIGLRRPDARPAAFAAARRQLWLVLPRLPPALLAAECTLRLLPEGTLAQWLGEGSGWRGLALATAVGVAVPGGPAVALPIAWALLSGGAAVSVVVAFVTSWSLIAAHRAMLFEWPLMGASWTLRRMLLSLPLPVLAGAAAGMLTRLGHG
ncbi:hypothetical protein [Algiphilus sp.]|uniref:hypothetical protein n=1 Tax=Algiphilus sp. TaxID=1872431 RepID=UPI003B51FAA3